MKKLLPALLLLASTHAYSQTDTLIGKNVSSQKDYRALTAKVIADAQTDQQKANAIFNWITTHIAYDIELAKNPDRKPETPKSVLNSGKATTDGYVTLYIAMAKEAGLHAAEVGGYARPAYYDNGDQHVVHNYSWVAVEIEGKWHIVDPIAGAGHIVGYTPWLTRQFRKLSKEKLHYDTKEHFEFRYSPGFFMTDPIAFRRTNVAEYPLWQMTKVVMPLSVFEAGVASVDSFNRLHSEISNQNNRMLMLSNLERPEYVMEIADDVNAYNKRYVEIKGIKMLLSAMRSYNTNPSEATAIDAKEMLKKSSGFIKEQKQLYPEHYSKLQKKNDSKHRETEEYVRRIETSNKMLNAKCDRYEHACKSKNDAIENKYEKLKKPIKVFVRTEKATVLKKPDAPDMQKLTDSFAQRSVRVKNMEKEISVIADSVVVEVQQFTHRYDAMIEHAVDCYLKLKDETIERISLNDQLDDEVRPLLPVVKDMLLRQLDTMTRRFFDDFDEVNKRYEALEKKHDALVDVLALMVKDAATFKTFTNNAPGLTNEYDAIVDAYKKRTGDYVNTFARHLEFNNNMKQMLKNVKEFAEDEKGLTEKITIAENARHNKEDKMIRESRNFDEGLNKRHQDDVRRLEDELDALLSKNR